MLNSYYPTYTIFEKIPLLDISINLGPYNRFVTSIIDAAIQKNRTYTCIANVHMLIEAHRNEKFANILNNANIVAPDGVPILWAIKLMHGIKQERVAGMDLLPELIIQSSLKRIPVFFYGGTENILCRTKKLLEDNYPELLIAGFISPPFRKLSDSENEEIICQINNSGAGLVFVILGCPKQEKWMALVQGRINATAIGIGGALPVFTGIQKRAPQWMQNNGLEWFFRLIQEPRRLFKRYLITNVLFILIIMREYLKIRILGMTKRHYIHLK